MLHRLSKLKTKHFIFSLTIIGLFLYLNTFTNAMFWDDDDFILNNIYIRHWNYLPHFFSQNLIAGSGLISNYWRPVLLIVFATEWHLWGSCVIGWHFVNTAFHTTNTILLFLLLKKIFPRLTSLKPLSQISISFLTSLFFLIHPLQTEAVAYVNSLGDSLSVFFMLTGLLAFLKSLQFKPSHNKFYLYFSLSLLAYCLSLMSKETTIIMPGIIFLVWYVYNDLNHCTLLRLRQWIKPFLFHIFPFGLIGLVYMFLRVTALNFNNTLNIYGQANPYTQSFLIRLYTFFKVILIYFRLMIYPTHLHMERSVSLETSFLSLPVILGLVLTLALTLIGFSLLIRRKQPLPFFGLAWFAIALFPTSNLLLPVSGLLYEHWLYFPLVGIFLIISWLLVSIISRCQVWSLFFSLFIIFYLLFLSFQTFHRNWQWHNPITFYQQTLEYSPNSYRLVNNLGMEFADIGNYDSALTAYQKALSIDPHNPVGHHNIGNLYKLRQATESAIYHFTKAISNDPNFIYSYKSLAAIYFNLKQYSQAEEILQRYLEFNQPATDVLMSLSQISTLQGHLTQAQKYLLQARQLDPSNPYVQQQLLKLHSIK